MRNFPHATVLLMTCIFALHGQDLPTQPPQDPPAVQPAEQKPPDPAGVQPVAGKPVDKRVFGVIPNNRTTSGAVPFAPITGKQKIVIGLKDSFDWPPYLTGALFAGLYQLENSNPSFGQGVTGYLKRWGTASADQVVGNMMTEGFIPAAFHQDPRYFMLGPGNGTKKHRLWHAVDSILVAKMDSGKTTFNFSEWGGNAAAAAVGNAYYPDSRSVADNVDRWLIAVGTDTLSNVLKEFWPDVKQWWKHKHGHDPEAATSVH